MADTGVAETYASQATREPRHTIDPKPRSCSVTRVSASLLHAHGLPVSPLVAGIACKHKRPSRCAR
jgi:hypothetical protein